MGDIITDIIYVERFTTTLIDKSDGDLSIDKAIVILHSAGYNASLIVKYVDQAKEKASKCLAKIIT